VSGTIVSMSDSAMTSSTGYDLRTVRVKAVNPGMVTDDYTASASIAGVASYGTSQVTLSGASVVYATGSGTVSNLSLMAGDKVTKGTTICTISSEALNTQLKNAQLSMKTSQLSENTAQNNMDDYNIKAPISGTVIQKNFKTGDTVKGMDSGTLAVVYDLSYLKLEMNVDELDISKVAVGQTVEITADALDGQKFTGTVDKVSINGTTANGVTTYPVTIVIKDFGSLLPGMNVSARIIGETVKDALCIPVDAVSRGNTVTVPKAGAMNADNTGVVNPALVEQKEVSLGRNDDQYIEVTDGLKEGDIVLIENQASNAMAAMMGG
jgi:HlyD family secretion protein